MREDGLGTNDENCQRDRADEKEFGGFTREDAAGCTQREFSLFLYWCPGLILVTQRSCFNCRRRLLCSVSYFVSGTMGIGFKYRIDRKGIVRYDSACISEMPPVLRFDDVAACHAHSMHSLFRTEQKGKYRKVIPCPFLKKSIHSHESEADNQHYCNINTNGA